MSLGETLTCIRTFRGSFNCLQVVLKVHERDTSCSSNLGREKISFPLEKLFSLKIVIAFCLHMPFFVDCGV